jgi:hypothetical protein
MSESLEHSDMQGIEEGEGVTSHARRYMLARDVPSYTQSEDAKNPYHGGFREVRTGEALSMCVGCGRGVRSECLA